MGMLAYIRNRSIMVKIPVTVVGVVVIMAATLLVPVVFQITSVEIHNIEKRVNAFFGTLGDGIIPYMIRSDYWAGFDFLEKQYESQSELNLRYVIIVDDENNIFASTSPDRFRILAPAPEPIRNHDHEKKGFLSLISSSEIMVGRKITKSGFFYGEIHTEIDLTQLKERLWNISLTAIIFTAIIAFVCGVIGYIISREIIRPLSLLETHVEKVGRGEIEFIDEQSIHSNDEIHRLMARFNQMAAALLERNRMARSLAIKGQLTVLGKLTASMAHEINNPLGGMLNVVSTLKRHGRDESIRQSSLDLLARGIKQIQSIVHAALLTYRYDDDDGTLRPVDLEDVRLLIQSEVKSSHIVLDWNNNIRQELKLSAMAIRQLVMNLLLNSCEAMPSGGELYFEATATDQHIALIVEDNGPGIDPELVDLLVRGDLHVDEERGGMGLWICLQLIHQLHGRWEIFSELGEGTRIEVNFPLNQESQHAA